MSVRFQDYYNTLGVDRNTSQDEVQKAYRKLARKLHPDVNKSKDAEEKFKAVNEAYEVLGDPEKRKRYNALGANWKAGQEFQPPPGWEDLFAGFGPGASRGQGSGFGDLGGFSDFFTMLFGESDMFGGADMFGRSRQEFSAHGTSMGRKAQARSREAEVTISLEDAFHGSTKRISLELVTPDGQGASRREVKNYDIKIPKGVTDGSTIRLAGLGDKGMGGSPAGDLLLKIKIAPHSRFSLLGKNIVTTLSITPWEASLGAKVEVPTLDGKVTLSVPAGAQSGQQLRLRGKGLPGKESTAGDMLAELKIVVPKELSSKEKELMQELAEESSFNPRDS